MSNNPAYKIILFSEENFKGKALVLFDGVDCFLHKHNYGYWNNKAKSIFVVKGAWRAGINRHGNHGETTEYNEHGGVHHDGKYATLDSFGGQITGVWHCR